MADKEGSTCTVEGLIVEISSIDPDSADAAEKVSTVIDKLECLPKENAAVGIPIIMIEQLAFRLKRPDLHQRLFDVGRSLDFRHPYWENGREEPA